MVGLTFSPTELIRVYVSMYKHARYHGRVILTCLRPPRFLIFLSFLSFNFSIKLRLFFNSVNGKIGLVIKVGLQVSFSHRGAHFVTQSTQ